MLVFIEKARRILRLMDGETVLFTCRIGLGKEPIGNKKMEGDTKTPEGIYHICLVKENGKYGRSLGLNYPSMEDAICALGENRINIETFDAISLAHKENRRPPWGTPLGGEIYIHEGGADRDWTSGCIAVDTEDMDMIFAYRQEIKEVKIVQ